MAPVPHVSIRARLIFLAVLLLAMLGVSSALLTAELARKSQAVAAEARLVSTVRNTDIASKDFGNLKYWVTDFAVTQLARSQKNADAAKADVAADLTAIAAVDPEGVAAIGREVEILGDLTRKAADAYSSDDSAAGSALVTQARDHILNVDRGIDKIVDGLERQALTRRDAAMREASRAVDLSVTGGIVGLAVALSLTALIGQSINAPLRRLERSMAAITRGELDAPIPPESGDEIGAMTKTLGLLRNSLIERNRLEGERRRAEAESAPRELRRSGVAPAKVDASQPDPGREDGLARPIDRRRRPRDQEPAQLRQ